MIPRIALTPGEPAGIGPDLCIRIAQQEWHADLVVVAAPDLLAERARQLGLPLQLQVLDSSEDAKQSRIGIKTKHRAGTLKVLPVSLAAPVQCGHTNRANAPYVLETLRVATAACLSGQCDALVTGPVQKSIINDAGIAFTGHTEFLAELTGTSQVVMMLAVSNDRGGLRVALVTTHLPLRDVSDAITAPRLEAVLRVLHHDLRTRLGVVDPHILVCGLNPHAGESGHLGSEDDQIIAPVLEKLRGSGSGLGNGQGMRLTGPLPADTLFIPKYLQTADAVLAMYHDQGLPVLKYAGFGRAINITLGLPFIRTSVDHGTALTLAGTGQADAGSLEAAIQAALDMVSRSIK